MVFLKILRIEMRSVIVCLNEISDFVCVGDPTSTRD